MSETTTSKPAPAPTRMTREAALDHAQRLEAQGDPGGADEIYRRLHRPGPPDTALLRAWARLRRRRGDGRNALLMLEQAVRGSGGAAALPELAAVLIDSGRLQDAASVLRQARPLSTQAGAALDFERGRLREANNQLPEAEAAYRAAFRADPLHVGARLALARLLVRAGRPEEACRAYTALLNRAPNHVPALSELAWLHGTERRFPAALACYDRLEAAGLDMVQHVSMVALGLMHVCDWSNRDALQARLETRYARAKPCVVEAYALLALSDDPAAHAQMATRMAEAIRGHTEKLPRPAARGIGEGRLKIGFLGGDFHQHATSLVLAGLIEAFDREGFEIVAYDYSPEDNSPIRARMVAAFDRFERLGAETQVQSAARIANDRIDILVDVKGYTERTRTEIMALRPAPVQVSFLGYAATQAAEWIDYVIADATVLPVSESPHWVERIVHLPGSFFPSDRTRPEPPADQDRVAQGLPADGFVFACFNNPFKITPAYFAAWMDMMRAVPGSVLWLYEGNPYSAANLRTEAERAGISPDRLAFTQPVSLEAHFARHGCIDLFLDTGPYGAHTTGVDALWCAVPLLTCLGRSFASRVGGSLLKAVGLPELVTESIADYVALGIELAQDRDRLSNIRARLKAERDAAPLFDTVRYARDLEAAFLAMAGRHRAGLAPEHFSIPNGMAS